MQFLNQMEGELSTVNPLSGTEPSGNGRSIQSQVPFGRREDPGFLGSKFPLPVVARLAEVWAFLAASSQQ